MKYNNLYTDNAQVRKRVEYLKQQGYELWDDYSSKKEAEELMQAISNNSFTELVYNPTSGAYLVYWKKKKYSPLSVDILPKNIPIEMAPNIQMLPARNPILDQPAFIPPTTPIAPDIDIFPKGV